MNAEAVPSVVVRHGENERAACGEGTKNLLVRPITVGPRSQLDVGARDFRPRENERRVMQPQGPDVRGQQPGETVR
jgi:hypothetical protein